MYHTRSNEIAFAATPLYTGFRSSWEVFTVYKQIISVYKFLSIQIKEHIHVRGIASGSSVLSLAQASSNTSLNIQTVQLKKPCQLTSNTHIQN